MNFKQIGHSTILSLPVKAFFWWGIGTSEGSKFVSLSHSSTAKVKRDKSQRKTTMNIDGKGWMRMVFGSMQTDAALSSSSSPFLWS